MASRKVKHARALARREKFMAEYRRTGLEALRRERLRRERQIYEQWKDRHEGTDKIKPHSNVFVENCPWCADVKRKLIESNKVPVSA